MAKLKEIKIHELIPDDKNFNIGSEFGNSLIEKSFNKFGAGRSILVDKNNKIIAGNKSTENYGATGGQKVIIVESDGTELIAVKRTDIDLDTPQGREMALADNATAKANIVWAEDVIADEIGIEVSENWGIVNSDKISDIDLDNFFEDRIEEEKLNKNKIILEYTEEDFIQVNEAFAKIGGSKEKIIFNLLGL
jgi:hypothetical protein